jgi:Rps23 Pro-64 3,4-dihydroxylase Tpa1-like proline 4-hydroxylase
MNIIRTLDVERLRREFGAARPFPYIRIDEFLEPGFASEVSQSFPSLERAEQVGKRFESVNEHLKIQVTDPREFPTPVKRLHEALSSQAFLDDLSTITGIPALLADETLAGGGMHQTGSRGRLDVHVDFNYLVNRQLHRRLNILVYFNPVWERSWGGNLELWDTAVRVCHHSIEPILNRCVIFETSEISFHGVERVVCPTSVVRKSFAGYYYTEGPPPGWNGSVHSTLFRARPSEPFKGSVLMPLERFGARCKGSYVRLKRGVKKVLGK